MRGEMGAKYFSRIIVLQRSRYSLREVSWCCGRVQSPNDAAQKIENLLQNTHTTIQKQIPTMVSGTPKNSQFLEFN